MHGDWDKFGKAMEALKQLLANPQCSFRASIPPSK